MSARQRLERILGPDLLELLGEFVDSRVSAALVSREVERRWITPEETAAHLGVSADAIRKRIARGTIRYARFGRRLLVDRRALDAELERDVR